jgi:hypothetical protein
MVSRMNGDASSPGAGAEQTCESTAVDGASEGKRTDEQEAFIGREAAEVYLLLDFLSGRADRSLRPTQEEQARAFLEGHRPADRNDPEPCERERARIERDLSDPTLIVLRTMEIQYPPKRSSQNFAADATFLVRARDVLNTRAAPVTGATIAYTSLVYASTRRARKGSGTSVGEAISGFAGRAYPQLQTSAKSLAFSISFLLVVLAIVLVGALSVSAYAAWGKVMLDTLDAVRHDGSALDQELNKTQSSLVAALDRHAPCERTDKPPPPVCDSVENYRARYIATAQQISNWEWPRVRRQADESLVTEQKQTEQWAAAWLAVLGNYLMPVLYGLLGSMAYVLRRHYDRLAAHLLSPRDLRGNLIRVALGVLIGGCIGLVYSGSATGQMTGVLGAAVTLSTAFVAFLAGYGVEAVFKALDTLITQVFRVNGTEKPARSG